MSHNRGPGIVYVPTTSRGWLPYPAAPPPVPVGVHHNTWNTGGWQQNPTFHHGARVPDQQAWLPHPAWFAGNPSTQPPADISRVPWLWVPREVAGNVDQTGGYPASRSNGHFRGQQPEVSHPPPPTVSSPPAFNPRVHITERVHHGRDTPHPHPGRLPPADDAYTPSPDYGPFRVGASPRAAGPTSQRYAQRDPAWSNTDSPFSSPEPSPVIPPAVIPSSSSPYHPPPANPSGPSSHAHAHARHYPSSSSYRGLPPLNNPLPRPPEHPPLAQALLRNAGRPTAPDAPVVPNRRR